MLLRVAVKRVMGRLTEYNERMWNIFVSKRKTHGVKNKKTGTHAIAP